MHARLRTNVRSQMQSNAQAFRDLITHTKANREGETERDETRQAIGHLPNYTHHVCTDTYIHAHAHAQAAKHKCIPRCIQTDRRASKRASKDKHTSYIHRHAHITAHHFLKFAAAAAT